MTITIRTAHTDTHICGCRQQTANTGANIKIWTSSNKQLQKFTFLPIKHTALHMSGTATHEKGNCLSVIYILEILVSLYFRKEWELNMTGWWEKFSWAELNCRREIKFCFCTIRQSKIRSLLQAKRKLRRNSGKISEQDRNRGHFRTTS